MTIIAEHKCITCKHFDQGDNECTEEGHSKVTGGGWCIDMQVKDRLGGKK